MSSRAWLSVLACWVVLGACSSSGSSALPAGSTSTTPATTTDVAAPATAPVSLPTTTVQATTTTEVAEPPRVLLVGDSTLLAIELFDAEDGLQGFSGDLRVASCMTLGIPSCGPEPVPPNAVETILAADGPYDIVVVMAGYDEWWSSFPDSLRRVGEAARGHGAETLLFLNFREGVGYVAPDGRTATEAFERNNETLREVETSGEIPELVVADWFGYTSGPATEYWMARDGVHLTRIGAWGLGDYISRWVAHLSGLACPDEPDGPPCENPDEVGGQPTLDEILSN